MPADPSVSRSDPWSRTMLLMAALLLTAVASHAQTGALQDGQIAVVTSDGFFLVGPEAVTRQLLTAADFALGSLCEPSVTWLEGSDTFVVTSEQGCGASGGLYRVTVHPGDQARVIALPVPAGLQPPPSFTDADYDPFLDRLWLLDRLGARLFTWERPLSASASTLELAHQLEAEEPDSVTVVGLAAPGSVLVSQRHLVQLLAPDGAAQVLWQWQGVGNLVAMEQMVVHGLKDEVYFARAKDDYVGILVTPQVLVPLNNWPEPDCDHPVRGPADIEWDYDTKRLLLLAEEGVACVSGGALLNEPNHVVELRSVAPAGAQNILPMVRTPQPVSGITGVQGDLAHVRFALPGLGHVGLATPASSGVAPVGLFAPKNGKLEPGSVLSMGLVQAPASAPAWFVVGLQPRPLVLQGAQLYPQLSVLLPFQTDAAGELFVNLQVPDGPLVAGLQLWSQWLVAEAGSGLCASWATVIRLAD